MSTQYRVRVIAQEPWDYEISDAEDVAQVQDAIARYGVWGYVTEQLVHHGSATDHPMSTTWEHLGSCFGFIGDDNEYMMEQAIECLPVGAEYVVTDEKGNAI